MKTASIPYQVLPEKTTPASDARIHRAAVRVGDVVYTGWRHSAILESLPGGPGDARAPENQGFVDQYGNFYSRYMAAKIAARARQIFKMLHQTLLSEELWDADGKPLDREKANGAYDPMADWKRRMRG